MKQFHLGTLALLTFLLAVVSDGISGTLVQFRTPIGDLELEMFDQDKPVTVSNFLWYVRSGRLRDGFVQRWQAGFVIQGGGFLTADRGTTNSRIAAVAKSGSITNEYSVGRTFSNTYGTIAMARASGQTNSATSEWYINLGDNSGLDAVDGGFTVFGRVLRGTNVLQRFNTPTVENGIFIVDLGSPLNNLPVLTREAPGYEDLVYVDISMLEVRVARPAPGAAAITWNSISNAVHHIEYTIGFPPTWQTLISTNGNGQTLEVTDDTGAADQRFYRVRVEIPE